MEDDEEFKALEQYDIMTQIPGMTEEKWESLPELEREELINEYNSRREKEKELMRLRDRKKSMVVLMNHGIGERSERERETKRKSRHRCFP